MLSDSHCSFNSYKKNPKSRHQSLSIKTSIKNDELQLTTINRAGNQCYILYITTGMILVFLYTEESTKNWLKIIPDNLVVQNNELELLDSILGEGNCILAKSFTLFKKYKCCTCKVIVTI